MVKHKRSSTQASSGPFGVLSRLFFQALANCGQRPQDISTYVRMYVAKRANAKRLLTKDTADKPPSEAAIQQEVQTVLRSIHGEKMTLKTLFQAVQVIGAKDIEITLTIHFPTGVSVSSTETVSTDHIDDSEQEPNER